MALSSSEHTLLVNTCDNMNIAAETCRQVLDMLRSLGASGVVDIATHNTAQEAHAEAKNLAHIEASDNSLRLGELGAANYWPTHKPLEFFPDAHILMGVYQSDGNHAAHIGLVSYKAITNTSKELVELSTAGSSYSNCVNGLVLESRIFGLKDSSPIAYSSSITINHGDESHGTNYLYSNVKFNLGNGTGNYVNAYSFSTGFLYAPNQLAPSLGHQNNPFATAYFQTAATVVSDRREKSGVAQLDSKAVDFVKALRPVHFTVTKGVTHIVEADEEGNATKVEFTPGVRHHWGLIAQEVQEALVSAGYDPSDCAVWQLADKDDPDSKQALRYEELIAPMIKVIQQQQERIEALERKVA